MSRVQSDAFLKRSTLTASEGGPGATDHGRHTTGETLALKLNDVAHAADLKYQDGHGVRYLRYWADERNGKIFCPVDAPHADTAASVHREDNGLVVDQIYQVQEGA